MGDNACKNDVTITSTVNKGTSTHSDSKFTNILLFSCMKLFKYSVTSTQSHHAKGYLT